MATIATSQSPTPPTPNQNPPVAGIKSFREVERPSASLCDYTTRGSVCIRTDPTTQCWVESSDSGEGVGSGGDTTSTSDKGGEGDEMETSTEKMGMGREGEEGRTPVVRMEPGTTVRVSPMEWKCNGWAEEHFHERLKLPDTVVGVGRGLVVTLEAMARECVAIALSPKPYFELGKTYAVHFGASCNLQTVIRRRIPSETTTHTTTHTHMPADGDDGDDGSGPPVEIHSDAVDTTVPTPQICTPHKFSSYWIALHDRGKLSVGLGKLPGVDCVATLDDSLYHALRSGPDAVRYVGIGNSALGRNARSLKVRNLRLMPLPEVYGNSPKQAIPLRDWSIVGGGRNGNGGEGTDEDEDEYNLEEGDTPDGDGNTGTTGRDASMWIEYQTQCHKAKMRAKKFGTEYRQPPPDAFFKWSEARRLRANPERGFVTGIDILSAEEREKARKRKERFEEEERGFGSGGGGGGGGGGAAAGYGEEGGSVDMQTNAVDGGETVYSEWDASTIATLGTSYDRRNEQILPMKQAWDHFDLVRKYRVDPPPYLFHVGKNSNGDSNSSNGEGDKTETENGADGTTKEEKETSEGEKDEKGEKEETMVDAGTTEGDSSNAHAVLEKIHLFAIDWAAFKQIRTDDIMAYFADYGPSYVEWLGELSCNVLFEDKYTSARAIEAMSRPIPHPKEVFEPETVIDTAAVTATGTTATTTSPNDEVTLPSPADANTPTDDAKSKQLRADEEENARLRSEELAVDLGSMGWRFCNRPIRKIQSNRFGRKGTRSRCLMRVATSLDVLEDRPTAWPKPPPGFTTTRVLGPGSDEVRERKRKRRRRSRKRGGGEGFRDANGMDVDEESVEDGVGDVGGGMEEDGEADAHDDVTIDRGLKSSRPGFTVEQMEEERRNKAKKATAAA